jgi:hypothetical protein
LPPLDDLQRLEHFPVRFAADPGYEYLEPMVHYLKQAAGFAGEAQDIVLSVE